MKPEFETCQLDANTKSRSLDGVNDWVDRMAELIRGKLVDADMVASYWGVREGGDQIIHVVIKDVNRGFISSNVEDEFLFAMRLGYRHNYEAKAIQSRTDVPDAIEALHMLNELFCELNALLSPTPNYRDTNPRRGKRRFDDALDETEAAVAH